MQRTEFLSFTPPNNSKNQNFGKIKKTPEDFTILLKWNQKTWPYSILSPTPPTNSGNQNFEKMKKKKKTPGDVIILHKWNQISGSYAILFLRYGM